MARTSGDFTNVTNVNFAISERTSAGAFVTNQAGTNITSNIPPSLQRFINSATLSGGATTARALPRIDANVTSGQAVDFTLRIGLPQMEQSSFATSPIKTLGSAAVTRSPDVATVDLTNAPWFNPVEGTIVVDWHSTAAVTKIAVSIDDATSNNRMQLGSSSSNLASAGATAGGVTQFFSTYGDVVPRRQAFAYKANDAAVYTDGNQSGLDSDFVVPTVTRIAIGRDRVNAAQIFGHIAELTYYPYRLSNEQLAQVTSI